MGGADLIELDDGKIYRKALYLMVKTMVSCKFSLNPIHWHWWCWSRKDDPTVPKVNAGPQKSWTYGFFLGWFFLPSRDQIYCSLDTRLPESSWIFLEKSIFSEFSISPPGGCRLHPNLHKKDPRGCRLAHFWWAPSWNAPHDGQVVAFRSIDRSIDR